MSLTSSNSILYVYGIVPAELSLADAPRGIDDAAVTIEQGPELAALVSELDGSKYGAAQMEENSGSVEWLSPRAIAHDLVLTWASDRTNGAVLPLPMFSLFSGRAAVQHMLGDRVSQLSAALQRAGEGREYALRVYRVDAELLDAVTTLSPRLGEMAERATAASPGQRYLLERKLEGEKKSEVRAVTQRIVDEIVSALAVPAAGHARSPIPRMSDADAGERGTMVLNAAFLVAPAALQEFQRTLTDLVERYGGRGFRFDFTGPWPPYHFVKESGSDA